MTTKTFAEQIRDLEATRQAKASRMAEIMQKAVDEGRSTDEAESKEFDDTEAEVKTLDADITRLKRMESLMVQRAAPVVQPANVPARSAPTVITHKTAEEQFKGQFYTQMVIAQALASMKGNFAPPSVIAQRRWKSNPLLIEVLKANEVAGGGAGSGEWGAELVQADSRYTGDFIEALREKTLFDALPLRVVPANVVIKGQDGNATGYWVGESKPIPVSKGDFSTVSLSPLKVAALAVVSNELLRDSSPAAEQLVRDALIAASSQRVDATFFSTSAVSAGVSPAGILNGLGAISSAGTHEGGLREDILALYAPFIAAFNASGISLVTNKSLAKAISLMVNALGQASFPNVTAEGGTLLGDKLYTGDNVGSGDLIAIKCSDIYRIGDTGVEVSVSRDATIEQSSAPVGATDTPVAMTQYMTSMFQEESTAIKVVRSINWAKRRSGAVAYVGDAAYVPTPPT